MRDIDPVSIEVLVLTYNRAPLIGATLESLLSQVHPASRICVLDNGSTDGTAEVVRSFAARGVELVCRGSNDPRACWTELQAMARGPWTMLFHDDDLLHPDYLRDAGVALAQEPQATVAVCSMRVHTEPESAEWGRIRAHRNVTLSGKLFAARLYGGFPMPFCSAIYRTDVLKRLTFGYAIFGKIFDRPFVIDAALAGKAVVMLDPYVKYRIHAKQDSSDQATGPFLPEVLALQRYYRKLLGEKLSDPAGRIFLRRNYKNLLGEYLRLSRHARPPMSQEEFFLEALKAEAASEWSLLCGRYYAALTQLPRNLERRFKVLVR